ncbi:hypothetical protein SERLA73DRAFT_138379 [Serpula lacrymans var. lacrymans S7.3]|uniref:RRM domain-containing protein n=2 Tax=Serpula lacrymans var. lacrymans TaxID=341189 RepID=F8Q1D2_SERL3|nr:uncharacterized protein SERLADRAFT_391985 [Serpula lacrymans var. lacrymans S7.9]EGN98110.1 hypothetical protein SERLA73DRAFT_138379 [Serpula lacrymans var. lacrymans S7.3]EGO23693.1 hypothetical protein SERLADRAFT_391985 [Serpula lacrymans var. lacrymans S7.9]
MSQYTVNVSGISPSTTETHLHDFFSFCGNIKSIDHKESDASSKSVAIHFEKPSAAHTALMLNGGHLDDATLHVTSTSVHPDHHDNEEHHPGAHIEQSDKPRAGIAAEYIAKGYKLSDHILQRAIELDNNQGISKRFLSYMQGLDTSVGKRALGPDQTISGKVQSTLQGATTRAKTIDEQKGYTKSAHEYYSKALSSPFGQKVFSFYTTTSKQVLDIHEEARRIADEHKAQQPSAPKPKSEETPEEKSTPVPADAEGAAPSAAGSEAQPDSSTQAAPTVV